MTQAKPTYDLPLKPPTRAHPYQAPKLTPLGQWGVLTLVNSICTIGCTSLFGSSHPSN